MVKIGEKPVQKVKFYIIGQVNYFELVISALPLSCCNLLRLTFLGSLFIHLSLGLTFFRRGLTWAFGMVLSASCPLTAFCPSSPPSSGLMIRRSSSGLYIGRRCVVRENVTSSGRGFRCRQPEAPCSRTLKCSMSLGATDSLINT